jgi:hypothetical protein
VRTAFFDDMVIEAKRVTVAGGRASTRTRAKNERPKVTLPRRL